MTFFPEISAKKQEDFEKKSLITLDTIEYFEFFKQEKRKKYIIISLFFLFLSITFLGLWNIFPHFMSKEHTNAISYNMHESGNNNNFHADMTNENNEKLIKIEVIYQ